MEFDQAENTVLDLLSKGRYLADSHRVALGITKPSSLDDVRAIGVDTNILKALRRELSFAEELFVTLTSKEIALIAPSQVLTEYWNNHQTFSKEEWNGFRSDLSSLTRRLEKGHLPGYDADPIREIEKLVAQVSADLEDTSSPAYLQRSVDLIQSMLESAIVPHASRTRFAEVAAIRLLSRTPPGFEDEKEKSAPGGDFFAWCEFLIGSLTIDERPDQKEYLWITNELKPDWKTGGGAHPGLVEEFYSVCGGRLSILTLPELRKILKDDERRSEGTPRDQAVNTDDQRDDAESDTERNPNAEAVDGIADPSDEAARTRTHGRTSEG